MRRAARDHARVGDGGGRRRRRAARRRPATPTRSPARSRRARSTTHRAADRLRAGRPGQARPVHLGRVRRPPPRRVPAAASARSPRVKALITGASGFVGPHLVAHLSVRATTSSRSTAHGPDPLDITDRDAVHDAFAAARGPTSCTTSRRSRTSASRGRTRPRVPRQRRGHAQRARRGARRGRRPRASWSAAPRSTAGSRAPTCRSREDAPLRPSRRTARARSRRRTSRCRRSSATGSATIRVRPFNHTGPGQSPRSSSPRSRTASRAPNATARDEIPVGSLDPVRDLTDVRDVVRAYRLLAERRRARARSTTSARAPACSRRARSPTACSRGPTRPLQLVVDPALVRPVDVPAPRRRPDQAARRHRLGARVHARRDARATSSTTPAPVPTRSRTARDRPWRSSQPSSAAMARGSWRRRCGRSARCAARRLAAGRSASRRASSTGTTSSAEPCTSSHGRGAISPAASIGSRLAIARIHAAGRAGTRRCAARRAPRVLEEPRRVVAPTCAATPAPRTSRGRARARRRAARDDRERPAEAEAGEPHAGHVGARCERVDRGAHVGEPAFDREVALGRAGAAERERERAPSPLRRAMRSTRLA